MGLRSKRDRFYDPLLPNDAATLKRLARYVADEAYARRWDDADGNVPVAAVDDVTSIEYRRARVTPVPRRFS